jgi:outer membrane protein assembly factor BamA
VRVGPRRRLVGLATIALLVGGWAGSAVAQTPWRTSYFPYPIGNPTDGIMLVARWQRVKDAPYFIERGDQGDVINPLSFAGAFSAEAGIGTLGSRFVRLEVRAPGLVPGWRFHGTAGLERTGRLGYYGIDGGFRAEPDNRTEGANDNFFRVHRSRFVVQGEVARQLGRGLRFSVATRLDHTRFDRLEDSTLFLEHFGRTEVQRTDFLIRPALVLDTRDREFVPANGLLLEASGGWGSAGSYGFGQIHARGYGSLREGTVLAGRVLYRAVGDEAPFGSRLYLMGFEREIAPSGPTGHRSFPTGAIASSRLWLASAEVRHDILNAGDFGAVTALGFLDWASAREPGGPSTDAFGGGVGVALRILRSAILTINFATGPNGFNFSMGNGWAF